MRILRRQGRTRPMSRATEKIMWFRLSAGIHGIKLGKSDHRYVTPVSTLVDCNLEKASFALTINVSRLFVFLYLLVSYKPILLPDHFLSSTLSLISVDVCQQRSSFTTTASWWRSSVASSSHSFARFTAASGHRTSQHSSQNTHSKTCNTHPIQTAYSFPEPVDANIQWTRHASLRSCRSHIHRQ